MIAAARRNGAKKAAASMRPTYGPDGAVVIVPRRVSHARRRRVGRRGLGRRQAHERRESDHPARHLGGRVPEAEPLRRVVAFRGTENAQGSGFPGFKSARRAQHGALGQRNHTARAATRSVRPRDDSREAAASYGGRELRVNRKINANLHLPSARGSPCGASPRVIRPQRTQATRKLAADTACLPLGPAGLFRNL